MGDNGQGGIRGARTLRRRHVKCVREGEERIEIVLTYRAANEVTLKIGWRAKERKCRLRALNVLTGDQSWASNNQTNIPQFTSKNLQNQIPI